MSDDQPGAGGEGGAAGESGGAGTEGGEGGGGESMTLEQAMSALKETRQEAAQRRKKQRELETELESLRTAGQSESERAISEAVKAKEDELTAAHRKEVIGLRVTAAAAAKLNDPEDAVRLLDLEQFVDVDQAKLGKAIGDALDTLIESKPYLAKSNGNGQPPVTPGARTRVPAGGAGAAKTDDDWLRKAARK